MLVQQAIDTAQVLEFTQEQRHVKVSPGELRTVQALSGEHSPL